MPSNPDFISTEQSDILTVNSSSEDQQPRCSPKQRGIRVTFDSSSRNSSPKSRSSREKEEEGFRSAVAQNIGLLTQPSLQNNQGDICKSDISTKTFPAGKMASLADDLSHETPEREVAPSVCGPNIPGPDLDAPLNRDSGSESTVPRFPESKDGMAEYAANYSGSPGSKKREMEKIIFISPEPETSRGSDLSHRGELRDPDGASSSSSPSVHPLKDPVSHRSSTQNKDPQHIHKKQKYAPITKTQPGAGVDDTMVIADLSEHNNGSSLKIPDAASIPSTNIGVALLVTFCFNPLFGAVAVYFSLMATKAYRDGKPKKGAKRARISIYIGLFSIVTTVLIVMAVVLMKAMEGQARQRMYKGKTGLNL